ncbi:MAG: hypothetical protein KA500_03210 [Rhodoluna sp.]|nr:hypothetical protein [Rhodoluna sp.]MBP6186480.1 hypothetical protein [Rhodoluna sp.]
MSPFTKIGVFEYWTNLLEAVRTSDDFEKSIAEYREKRQGWSAYMSGRRVGEYLEFARLQRMQIHGTALVADDDPVCSCGLVARLDVPAAPNQDHILFANPGHIDYANGQLVTAFYIRHRSEETQDWPLHFFCQICSALELAELTGDEKLDRILLEDFRMAHGHELEID